MIIETCVKENIFDISDYIPSKTHLHTNQHEWQKESYKTLNSSKTKDVDRIFLWKQNYEWCVYCGHNDF